MSAANSSAATPGPAQPFFLAGQTGERFCLYHPAQGTARGAFIYVHPFAEEMNKCRRMAAMQARAFARSGIAVLQIDLYGCGDSSGDFGDARWPIWLDDLQRAQQWLAQRHTSTIGWWGVRLGALLALEAAGRFGGGPALLWQPVISGEAFLTQFLRMRVASAALAAKSITAPAATALRTVVPVALPEASGTQAIRAAMTAGEAIEVGGYELAPALAAAIDTVKMSELAVPDLTVYWIEVVAEDGRSLPPAAANAEAALRIAGVDLHLHLAVGPAFWTTQEVVDCPGLLAATGAIQDLATV